MLYKIVLSAVALLLACSFGYVSPRRSAIRMLTEELLKFQGTWVMVSSEKSGKLVADERVDRTKILYEGKTGWKFEPNHHPEPIIFEILDIDTSKEPKQMRAIEKNGPSMGKTLVAIYRFEGPDQYTFAYDPSGSTILTEFTTKEGTEHIRKPGSA